MSRARLRALPGLGLGVGLRIGVGLGLGLGLALASCLACATTSLERRPWQALETPHFEVLSSLGPDASAALARDLEAFVLACEASFGASLDLPMRIRVYAHDGKGLEHPFGRGNQPSWFAPSLGGGVLVLRVGAGFEDATPETRFALARTLAHGNGALETPLWYDEGMSAFVSTARTDGARTALGEPRFDLLGALRDQVWPSANEVLAATASQDWGRRQREIFRARAWAIVHFALLGPLPDSAPRPGLDLRRARELRGDDTRDWFGVPADDFDPALRSWVRALPGGERLMVRSRGGAPDAALARPETLDCARVGEALGELALGLERDGLARRYYRYALTCDPSSARARAGLGLAESLRGDFETATSLREEALAAAPHDPQVQLAAGRSLEAMARAADAGDRVRVDTDTQARTQAQAQAQAPRDAARAHYARAAALAPDDPVPLEWLAQSILSAPDATPAETRRALAALERAQTRVPASLDVMLARARAHASLEEPALARDLALIVARRADDDALAEAAGALLARLAPETRP